MDDLDVLLSANGTGGSANAYTLTTGLSLAAYVAGQSFRILANFSNSGAATINVDGLGAKAITKNGTTALASGDIVSGNIYDLSYDGTRFQLVGTTATGVYQPLDALITAIAALTTADDRMLDFTGTDTVAVVSYATVLSNIAALNQTAGDARYALLAGGAFTGNTSITKTTPVLSLVGSVTTALFETSGSFYIEHAGSNRFILSSSLAAFSVPLQARVAASSETTGALTSASANLIVNCSGNVTLPASGMTDGDIILIDPRGTARTITRPAAHTMYISNADAATGTTGAHNIVIAKYHGSSKWSLQGSVT